MSEPAAVLVLAAGFSRRFGDDKRQARVPNRASFDGSLLELTLQSLAGLGWPITLVLRGDDQPYAETLQEHLTKLDESVALTCVFAHDSELGMGHSLAAGASALARQGAQRLLIALGDMPYLRTETTAALGAALLALDPAQPGVVRPRYQNQPGHPVGLSGLALPVLKTLTGDSGARALLKEWSAVTHWLDVDDPGVIHDVDRPADLGHR